MAQAAVQRRLEFCAANVTGDSTPRHLEVSVRMKVCMTCFVSSFGVCGVRVSGNVNEISLKGTRRCLR